MYKFTLNGQPQHASQPKSITTLLEELQLSGKKIAIEKNGKIIPKSTYHSTMLQDNDNIEIVTAVGGG